MIKDKQIKTTNRVTKVAEILEHYRGKKKRQGVEYGSLLFYIATLSDKGLTKFHKEFLSKKMR